MLPVSQRLQGRTQQSSPIFQCHTRLVQTIRGPFLAELCGIGISRGIKSVVSVHDW